jgi:hypothetical protein
MSGCLFVGKCFNLVLLVNLDILQGFLIVSIEEASEILFQEGLA